MVKIVFFTVPKISPDTPPAGPAVLKAYLLKNNIQSIYYDWNRDFFDICDDKKYWEFGTVDGNKLQDQEFDRLWQKNCKWIENYFDQNIPKSCEFIGLSLFSFESAYAAEKLCKYLKDQYPNKKIVLGGPGSNTVTNLLETKMVDYIIPGDGEEALVHLLQGIEHPGINNYYIDTKTAMDDIPVGNFDDLKLAKYKGGIYIRTSKGCVLNCTFCDVRSLWPKYQYQSTDKTVDDIRILTNKYPEIKEIKFADSLLNGSVTKFRDLITQLANEKFPVSYEAKIIIRPPKHMPASDYELLAKANFKTLLPGVESGSEKVREHMGKIFSNDDLLFFMDNMQKNNLQALFLFIIGYITETEKDFQETLDLITLINTKYPDVVPAIAMGEQLFVLPGTQLYDMEEHFDVFDHTHWEMNGITKNVREDRNRRLIDHATELNITAYARKASEGDTVLKLAS